MLIVKPSPIKTLRTVIRPFIPSDAEAAFGWFGNSGVMRFTPHGADKSLIETVSRIEGYRKHQNMHGFSKWIVLDAVGGNPIGDSGLWIMQPTGNIDLGVRLIRPYWSRGFGTEIVKAWIRAAFEDFDIDQLTTFANPDNAASHRIMEKCGFERRVLERVMGMKAVTYSLNRDSD
ncbi:MAG: GNAT family N-acetyltransferase [Gemmatimonadota bacterium]